jgi:hypothetical protein
MTTGWDATQCDAVDFNGQRCALKAGHPGSHATTVAQSTPTVVVSGPAAAPKVKSKGIGRAKLIVGVVAAFFAIGAISNAMTPPAQTATRTPTTTAGPTPSPVRVAAVEDSSPSATLEPARTPNPTRAATPAPTPEPTSEPTREPTPEPTAKPVTYNKLTARNWSKVVKDPDAYVGRTYQIWACITQFDAATGSDTFRGQASYAKQSYWYTDGDNALFTGTDDQLGDFVQDDIVQVNVTTLGAFSYDTQIGGNTTAPWFTVDKIIRRGSCE